MNSVLSLLSLRCIDVIQSAIVVRVFSMVLIVFSSDVCHLAVKDFLMLWSSANPSSVTDDGMESLISEQQHVKRLAPLQLPCGTLNLRSSVLNSYH